MSELIIKPKTCGTCAFSRPLPHDLLQVICGGVPPTPCIAGGQQTVAGVQFHIELLRPQMSRAEPACALWKTVP